jgi:hypothetical protein
MADRQTDTKESSWVRSHAGAEHIFVKNFSDAENAAAFLRELFKLISPDRPVEEPSTEQRGADFVSVLVFRPSVSFDVPPPLQQLLPQRWSQKIIADVGPVYTFGSINNYLREPDFQSNRGTGLITVLEQFGLGSSEAQYMAAALIEGQILVVARVPNDNSLVVWEAIADAEHRWRRKRVTLRVGSHGHVPLAEFRSLLSMLENAYNGLTFFESMDGPAMLRYLSAWEHQTLHSSRSRLSLRVPLQEQLVIGSVRLSSPGFLEFLGSLNPLECIRRYLQDRHERGKDERYRESAENIHLDLENQLLANKIITERLVIARSVGLTDAEMAPMIQELFVRPLRKLEKHQQTGMITSVEIIRELKSESTQAS